MKKVEGKVQISDSIGEISILSYLPDAPSYILILGHGAGAGMHHKFMEDLALALLELNIGTIRYNFPYMENKKGRPDVPAVAHKTILQVVKHIAAAHKNVALILAGKSFGGRMASQAMAKHRLPNIKGLVFYGFPLHSPAKPGVERAEHLFEVEVPMLFLQGSKDNLARIDLLEPLLTKLPLASSVIYEGGNHSFRFGKKLGIDVEKAIAMLASDTKKFLENKVKFQAKKAN
ncbi:MAG: alpha/beta hydrolase [Saprospiraceae bacterium]|nr:alpha/beta hydrolase [Saprospiraceae bacterium]